MKYLYLHLIASLSILSVKAQEKLLLEEKFSDNRNKWTVVQNSDFSVHIDKGSLHLSKIEKNRERNGCLWYSKKIKGFNTLHNFKISFYSKFVSGGDAFESLDWQWGDINKQPGKGVNGGFYQLNLNLNGSVRLDYFNKGWGRSFNVDIRKQLDDISFEARKLNKYDIIQEGDTLSFSINGRTVFRQFISPIPGDAIGIQQCLKSSIDIDRITIRQTVPAAGKVAEASTVKLQRLPPSLSPDSVIVFPNPFDDVLRVRFNLAEEGHVHILLTDLQGRNIYDDKIYMKAGMNEYKLLTNLPAGLYILTLMRPKQPTIVKKVVRK